MTEDVFASVVVDVKARQVNRTFQYLVPPNLQNLLKIGHRVLVPFGARRVTGFVVETKALPDPRIKDLKPILQLMDEEPLLSKEQIELAGWLAAYYACTLAQAMQTVAGPELQVKGERKIRNLWPAGDVTDYGTIIRNLAARAPQQAKVLQAVLNYPGLTRKDLAAAAGVSTGVVDSLLRSGLVTAHSKAERRNPYPVKPGVQRVVPPPLTREQEKNTGEVCQALNEGKEQVFLLQGVTGSGKTEVYLRCAARTLELGRQAMVLVPEISLTSQMVRWFKDRFGEQVAVLHSRLSRGEKYDEWKRIKSGEAGVVLGARSAVFAPLTKPGLLVIDEEHESSYKQEEAPRYHARAVALYLARRHRAVLILGSATPSLESASRALPGGPYRRLTMFHRIEHRPLPVVQVVDLRKELRDGNRGLFSVALREKMTSRLEGGEQILLFLNRRGFNTLVVCRECGLVVKCPHCDISLTYHSHGRVLCHYCHYSIMAPGICPSCRSPYLSYFGTGTQKVEQEVQKLFPGARVLRMDRDTTAKKGSHEKIIKSFSAGDVDILIGTQMVAKGLDLPGVTLVGVVAADLSLHMPDFRAAERTFQVLTQVAGRAGRGQSPGEVVVQTYCPEHYAIRAAANHDYAGFFSQELAIRKELLYPPFTRMARFIVTGAGEDQVEAGARVIREALAELLEPAQVNSGYQVVGPAPAPLGRVRGRYRWHIVVWGREVHRLTYQVIKLLEERWTNQKVNWLVDIEPQSMM
ncbi:MAG: primosomal protein N' [Bacillota bacterium]|jgi:primosomal protein N' (replication factor Y)